MRHIKIVIAMLAIILGASAAQAGGLFKFGPKVGVTVNSLHMNQKLLDGDNKCGWTAGVMTEFRVPVIGVGADLSLMYVRRNSQFMLKNNLAKDNRDYIEIPLNLRYNFSLPVVSRFVVPYLAVGPSVSLLTSKKHITEAYKNQSVDWALNFGIGVQLLSRIDVNARYGLGLSKAMKSIGSQANAGEAGINGKNRYWTVSVAYLF